MNIPHFSVPFNHVVKPQLPTSSNTLDLPSQGMEYVEITGVSMEINLVSAPRVFHGHHGYRYSIDFGTLWHNVYLYRSIAGMYGYGEYNFQF